MWKMPILPKKRKSCDVRVEESGEYHSVVRPMPASYMSEYSVLGLFVDRHEEAVRLLAADGFNVSGNDEVALEAPEHLHRLARILAESGLDWEIADTVVGVYQG